MVFEAGFTQKLIVGNDTLDASVKNAREAESLGQEENRALSSTDAHGLGTLPSGVFGNSNTVDFALHNKVHRYCI
jgi:hypothetical protein